MNKISGTHEHARKHEKLKKKEQKRTNIKIDCLNAHLDRERGRERESYWEVGLHGKPFEMNELNYLYEKKSGKWNIHFYIFSRSNRYFSFTDFTFRCIHHSTQDAISIWLAFSASTSRCFSMKTFSSLHFLFLSRTSTRRKADGCHSNTNSHTKHTHSHWERIKIFKLLKYLHKFESNRFQSLAN